MSCVPWLVLAILCCSHTLAQTAAHPRFATAWGTEGSQPGQFDFPIGIAITSQDEVLVTDHYNNRVEKFNADGRLLSVLSVLPHPGGIAVDREGWIYVSHFPVARKDEHKTPDRVAVYSPSGELQRQWGSTGNGDGQFDFPGGIAIAPEGRVYVADQTNRRVQVFDRQGRFLFKWGTYGRHAGEFGGSITAKSRVGGPQFLAINDRGDVFTTEGSECRIQYFSRDGRSLGMWGGSQDVPGALGGGFPAVRSSLRGPIGLCFDHKRRLWVTAVSGRVQQFTAAGEFLGVIGGGAGSGPRQFLAPHGIAVNSRNELFIVDSFNHRIQKYVLED